jgi:CheY-like chemotaxis protein
MMLTSSGEYGDAARCKDLGIDAYLTKPIGQADLLTAICGVLEPGSDGEADAAPRAPDRSAIRRRVLLAEDNVVNQRVAVGLLTRRGHDVTVAVNGLEAIAALEREAFDVVLMDVQMPEMGGVEATAVIRARERRSGGRVRIVALTAHALTGDRERFLAADMDGYLAKPIDRLQLFAMVELGTQHAASPAVEMDGPVFDRSEFLERAGGSEDLAQEVIALFLEDCPTQLAAIKAAIHQGDTTQLEDIAHTLKGAAANLSARGVVAAAGRLEVLGHDRRLDEAAGACQRLEQETAQLLTALRVIPWQHSETAALVDHR